jgi:hypothetical protein
VPTRLRSDLARICGIPLAVGLGRAWISRHSVEIRAVSWAGWVGLCGRATAWYSAPTWEKGGCRPVFARISPEFVGSPSLECCTILHYATRY